MRAKKTPRTPRSVRYLLSADRRLQKLSLRKLSTGEKKAAKARPQSSRPKQAAAPKPSIAPPPKAYNWRVVVVAAACVMAAAALMTARQPTDEGGSTDAAQAQRAPIVAPAAASKTSNTSKSPLPKPAAIATSKPVTTATPEPVTAITPKPVMTKPAAPLVPRSVETPTARTQSVESGNGNAPADTMRNAEPGGAAIVTITGCVQRDGDTFWMKDTSGADAPKSRSWKTGFFRKRPTRIELVYVGSGLRLASYVDERVSATGTIVDREMRAQSLRRIATSCD